MVKTPSWQHSLFPDSSPQQRKTPVAKRPEAGSGNPASSVSSGGVEEERNGPQHWTNATCQTAKTDAFWIFHGGWRWTVQFLCQC